MNVSTIIYLVGYSYVSLKSNGPPFCLLSTWVTTGVQEAFDQAREAELTTQAKLMASYLDIDSYHTQHCNAQSELIFLQKDYARPKLRQNGRLKLVAALSPSADTTTDLSSPPRPTLPPLLPEEVHRYKEYMNAESTNDRSDSNASW
ncbi:hypothetical protein BDR05DRAFT_1002857 [Suillus weaverae]|nr:hypothetical protein BDR05DRAFT_1002857 [Suillus weaverae]